MQHKTRHDPCPDVPVAGYQPPTDGTNAGACLNEDNNRPPTPERVKNHLKSYKHPLGKTPPVRNPNVNPDVAYGRANDTADGPGQFGRPLTPSSLHQYITAKDEEHYLSKKREPLGKSKSHGIVIKDPNMSHGRKSIFSESAKKLLYDPSNKVPTSSITNAGNQALNDITRPTMRNYDWSATAVKGNPQDFRFGKSQVGPQGPTGAQLTKDMVMRDDTKVIDKRVLDVRNRRKYPIGRTRNVSGHVAKLPDDFVFGKPGNGDMEESTRICIHGYSAADQQPDKDLGISKQKLKKGQIQHPEDRVFGVPSLRKDVIAPKIKSVADSNNYGDELGAQDVMYPEPYAYDGVEEKDFLKIRKASEIREIFTDIGEKFSDKEFTAIASEAEKLFGGLSIDSFRTVYNKKKYGIGSS